MRYYDIKQLQHKRVEVSNNAQAVEAIDKAIDEASEALAFNRACDVVIDDWQITINYATYKSVYWLF